MLFNTLVLKAVNYMLSAKDSDFRKWVYGGEMKAANRTEKPHCKARGLGSMRARARALRRE